MLAASAAAWGQAPTPQTPAAPAQCADAAKAAAGCPASAPPKSAAERFPFPGEQPSTSEQPATAAPDAPGQTGSAKPKLPEYPGDPDKPAANAPGGRPALPAYPGDPDAASSSSSSSSSSSAGGDPGAPDSGAGPLADAGSSGDNTRVPKRKKLPKVTPETPESRAAEDLTVADFYQKDGNYIGAYARAKDAVQYQPNDPYAHFALAEAARKLGKKDEAREQYAEVLKLDPIPKQLKETQRALAELGASR